VLSRIGLGTVQFGMHYGVSNRRGQPDEAEVAAILDRAEESGIGYLDTALAYPKSEVLIGRHLAPRSKLRIVTKTAPIKSEKIERGDKTGILDGLALSMERLRVDRLYGVLLHYGSDLGKPGWQYLVDALTEARARGWVGRVGASVYTSDEMELVESRFVPDVIQGPFNCLDTRLISSKCFSRLKARGTEMHARSVFLQGLLLMSPASLPAFFEPVKATLASLRAQWAERGESPLAACLQFVLGHPDIDAAIVGVNSASEFDEIRSAAAFDPEKSKAVTESFPPVDKRYLDPSLWPSFDN
jgi:aryl-alcohol dehydrogenase-like predicted oxidoreductase